MSRCQQLWHHIRFCKLSIFVMDMIKIKIFFFYFKSWMSYKHRRKDAFRHLFFFNLSCLTICLLGDRSAWRHAVTVALRSPVPWAAWVMEWPSMSWRTYWQKASQTLPRYFSHLKCCTGLWSGTRLPAGLTTKSCSRWLTVSQQYLGVQQPGYRV